VGLKALWRTSMGSGAGGVLFTTITGWVVQHYSYTPAFIGFGLLPLICAGILWAWLGPLDRKLDLTKLLATTS